MKGLREEVFKHHPKMEGWKRLVLSLPLILSVSWILYLQFSPNVYVYYGRELLAPADTTPLMIALIIFTIGYIIFLFLMFSENIKEFFARRSRH